MFVVIVIKSALSAALRFVKGSSANKFSDTVAVAATTNADAIVTKLVRASIELECGIKRDRDRTCTPCPIRFE